MKCRVVGPRRTYAGKGGGKGILGVSPSVCNPVTQDLTENISGISPRLRICYTMQTERVALSHDTAFWTVYKDSMSGDLRLVLVEASDNECVPKWVDLCPSIVHNPCQPGEQRLRGVVMTIV